MPESTAIVWFRRDLRVRDHPALACAAREHDRVVPLFVFDPKLLDGRFRSPGRTQWMLDALHVLDDALKERGGKLVVRRGSPKTEVRRVANEVGATHVHVSDDATPYGRARDDAIEAALGRDDVELVRHPGNYVTEPGDVLTQQDRPYTVFTPYLKRWKQTRRRDVERAPTQLVVPRVKQGDLPKTVEQLGMPKAPDLVDRPEPGEDAARRAVDRWVRGGLESYGDTRNDLATETSRMGPYLKFGCISALALDERCREATGASTYRDELAWRDFYAQVLFHVPEHAHTEFVQKYRSLTWPGGRDEWRAWTRGETGYPVVDAAMRQLVQSGFMHNRARMIVGSFLTKDLGIDWRDGEAFFMEHLLDGDQTSNNGGWQWIASTGTDPKPYFQRLFNPTTQQERFDPSGDYVRRWVPELRDVPGDRLATPWEMTDEEQEAAGCVIGRDYPDRIVDHAEARKAAIERFRAAG